MGYTRRCMLMLITYKIMSIKFPPYIHTCSLSCDLEVGRVDGDNDDVEDCDD